MRPRADRLPLGCAALVAAALPGTVVAQSDCRASTTAHRASRRNGAAPQRASRRRSPRPRTARPRQSRALCGRRMPPRSRRCPRIATDKPDEIIVIGQGWRLPDLGSEWRKKQEEAEDTGRFHVTFMPLYDPSRPPQRDEMLLAPAEWQTPRLHRAVPHAFRQTHSPQLASSRCMPAADRPATHLPTVKQLRYFVALAELKHFGRAAAQCFVSQSAFSIAIQELETLLGANLVDRTNRRVTITATGREIASLAKLCLQDLTALVEHARGHGNRYRGRCNSASFPRSRRSCCRACCPHCGEASRSSSCSCTRT